MALEIILTASLRAICQAEVNMLNTNQIQNHNTRSSPRIYYGPLIFIIYMNYFSRSSNLLFSIFFADDTSVFIEGAYFENISLKINT